MHATNDHRARLSVAKVRGLPAPGIAAAIADGILSFGEHHKARAWFIRDERAGCARRLDGQLWRTQQGDAKALDTSGTSGVRVNGWPVGITRASERDEIIVCEGGPDALAAYAVREALHGAFGIVCLNGSALTIHESAREYFAGKRVRFIAHADAAGLDFAERNGALLLPIAAQVSIATLDGLLTTTGAPVSDLCDALAFRKPWCVPEEIAELFDFTRTSPRERILAAQSTLFPAPAPVAESVTQDHPRSTHRGLRSTQEMGRREKKGIDALHEKAREQASSARGQAHRGMFLLAQAVCGHFGHRDCKADSLSTAVFDTWFTASRPNLDPKETRAHYLGRFRGGFRKVRVIPTYQDTLAKAQERAKTGPLPEIPDASDASHGWRVLAAVCRELQSAAGEVPFFIGMRDAAEIATGLRHPQTGSRILEALAEFGVIRCVKKGEPKLGGDASLYLYLLP